jgi:hypothetical protein
MIRGKHSAKELDQPIGMLVKREPPPLSPHVLADFVHSPCIAEPLPKLGHALAEYSDIQPPRE